MLIIHGFALNISTSLHSILNAILCNNTINIIITYQRYEPSPLNLHRKCKLNSLNKIPSIKDKNMLVHIPVLKFIEAKQGAYAFSIQFCTIAAHPYRIDEMYWIQPIQPGKLPRFLQRPEKQELGTNRKVITTLADFQSFTMLPTKRPIEDPVKAIVTQSTTTIKNGSAVLDRPINQQAMIAIKIGTMNVQGRSITQRLAKQLKVEQSFAFYSLRKTARYRGKLRAIGAIVNIIIPKEAIYRTPRVEFQLFRSLINPVKRALKMMPNNLTLVRKGCLLALRKSRQSSVLKALHSEAMTLRSGIWQDC